MEVRIRRSSEASARHLTTTTLERIDKVIPTIERWGVEGEQGLSFTGQFVAGDEAGGGAYFEVIVCDDETGGPDLVRTA